MSTVYEVGLVTRQEYDDAILEYKAMVKRLCKGLPRKHGVALRAYGKEILQEAEYGNGSKVFTVGDRFISFRNVALSMK